VVPLTADKRFYTFRNRGYVFSRYGRWGMLAADVARYGWYYLVSRHLDLQGYGHWAADTWRGIRGDLGGNGTPAGCEGDRDDERPQGADRRRPAAGRERQARGADGQGAQE
jgi:rhamnopyranosyl-N-acetylglucosaminyl-diphospho-decaprenol beta-1,3/1,4-galactofuranosyltransferase